MGFKLFDLVTLNASDADRGIVAGTVGTIVDIYPDGEFEIEFANKNGETTAMFAVSPDQVRVIEPILQAA